MLGRSHGVRRETTGQEAETTESLARVRQPLTEARGWPGKLSLLLRSVTEALLHSVMQKAKLHPAPTSAIS